MPVGEGIVNLLFLRISLNQYMHDVTFGVCLFSGLRYIVLAAPHNGAVQSRRHAARGLARVRFNPDYFVLV